jgi:hypothetical protein
VEGTKGGVLYTVANEASTAFELSGIETDDHPQDECGVFAIFAPQAAADAESYDGEGILQAAHILARRLQSRGRSASRHRVYRLAAMLRPGAAWCLSHPSTQEYREVSGYGSSRSR